MPVDFAIRRGALPGRGRDALFLTFASRSEGQSGIKMPHSKQHLIDLTLWDHPKTRTGVHALIPDYTGINLKNVS